MRIFYNWLRPKGAPLLLTQPYVPDGIRIPIAKPCLAMEPHKPKLPSTLMYYLTGTDLYVYPDQDIINWFNAVCPEYQRYVSLYIEGEAFRGLEIPVTFEFRFSDVGLAQMYKLAWGGK